MKRCVLWVLLLLIVGNALGFGLIFGIFLLPAERMFDHVKESAHVFEDEAAGSSRIPGFNGALFDPYAIDAILLNNAVTKTESGPIDAALYVYRAGDAEGDPVASLLAHLSGGSFERTEESSSFWNGYLVTLKPLLLFMGYDGIKMINALCQAILMLAVFFLIWRKTSLKYAVGFMIAFLFLLPAVIPLSLHFSSVLYITLIASVVMLLFHERFLKKHRYVYFFLTVGMASGFFDFLAYPLLALFMPMVLFMILSGDDALKEKLKKLFGFALCWGVGYLGMLSGKWFIHAILTGESILGSMLAGIRAVWGKTPYHASAAVIDDWYPVGLVGLTALIKAALILKYRVPKGEVLYKILPFAIIAFMPLLWFIPALQDGGGGVHALIAVQSMSVFIFALGSLLSACFKIPGKGTRIVDRAADKIMRIYRSARFLEMWKFALAGGLSFIVDYGVMVLFKETVGVNAIIASGIGFTVSVVFNYILCVAWVFEGVDKKDRAAMAVFLLTSVIGLGLTMFLMWIFVNLIGVEYRIAKIFVTVVVMAWNYVTKRMALMRSKKGKKS